MGSDGPVVKSTNEKNKKLKTDDESSAIKKKGKLSKQEWEVMHKLKPKDDDKERERILCSIATKVVVQLFSAVKEQQKNIDTKIKEVGTSETKRDKAMSQFNKNQFLDKMKQKDNKGTDSKQEKTDEKDTEEKRKVLRNDFMIGAKMKDWDKESDSDQESS